LAIASSRRRVLKGLAGGVLGTVAGALAQRPAGAAPCPPERRCGSTCCPFGEQCVGTGRSRTCCPAAQACGKTCLASPCLGPCEVCDPTRGACVPASSGTPCEDGNPCTVGDTCQGGNCQAGAVKACPGGGTCCGGACCDVASGAEACVSDFCVRTCPASTACTVATEQCLAHCACVRTTSGAVVCSRAFQCPPTGGCASDAECTLHVRAPAACVSEADPANEACHINCEGDTFCAILCGIEGTPA
ncbi:MAG: hypothetical protein AVDCRST_MAG73-3305, partial [uncultured Thermomicrobiales bacterium]